MQALAGHFTTELVRHSIAGNGQTLRSCFASILSIADYLLRSVEPLLRRHGVLLYSLAFQHFPEIYHGQEVLGTLIAHIGSRSPHEIDGALNVLETLIHLRPCGCTKLATHASFIDVQTT